MSDAAARRGIAARSGELGSPPKSHEVLRTPKVKRAADGLRASSSPVAFTVTFLSRSTSPAFRDENEDYDDDDDDYDGSEVPDRRSIAYRAFPRRHAAALNQKYVRRTAFSDPRDSRVLVFPTAPARRLRNKPTKFTTGGFGSRQCFFPVFL